jgi:hypothetical protein
MKTLSVIALNEFHCTIFFKVTTTSDKHLLFRFPGDDTKKYLTVIIAVNCLLAFIEEDTSVKTKN